jgi:hypothetical protein
VTEVAAPALAQFGVLARRRPDFASLTAVRLRHVRSIDPVLEDAMAKNSGNGSGEKIMLVGYDHKHLLEKRFVAAGCAVTKVSGNEAAIDHARHELFRTTVLVSRGSLINIAETVFNLLDVRPSMKIIVLVDRLGKHTNRFLKQLLEHPIAGTQIVTRRQLQQLLHGANRPAPPGQSG